MHHPTDRIEYTTAFGTPVVKHWLEQEIGSPAPLPPIYNLRWFHNAIIVQKSMF